ncbi:WD40 repeat domain-containing protein [Geitlerinema sp. PCC 9228]|uniref:WD40 repeat domain-containing protein n=1 Tax=Geitlerinema sp. PCC 9228 TaxID=111611 RepID=UPI001480BD8C|nr:WD40 repeat domain-containing protein [Geitlerinema sp. PCC 9228]
MIPSNEEPRNASSQPQLEQADSLIQAGNVQQYAQLLSSYEYIAAKVNHPEFGIKALIEDYGWLATTEVATHLNWKTVRALRLIQKALQLSAPTIEKDRTQLASHLWGRLMEYELPEIRQLLEQAQQNQTRPWLRPLAPNLMPAGDPLLHTLRSVSKLCICTPAYYKPAAVAISADGSVAVFAHGSAVKVWDLTAGTERFTLKGDEGEIQTVAISADGSVVVAGLKSADGIVQVWDLTTGSERFTLEGHSSVISSVAISADGSVAVSGSDDQTIKVWDLTTGKVWDLTTGSERFTLEGHSHWVTSVAISADASVAVSGSIDKTIEVWDLITGSKRFTLEGHSRWIAAVAISADGSVAVSGSADRTVKVWDLTAGTQCYTLKGHINKIDSVGIDADASVAISGSVDQCVQVWDLTAATDSFPFPGHQDCVTTVAISADGSVAVSGSDDQTIKVWDAATGTERFLLKGHISSVEPNALGINADGSVAVSGSRDRMMKVWDAIDGTERFTLKSHSMWVTAVAISADGLVGACASYYPSDEEPFPKVTVWDLTNGTERFTLTGNVNGAFGQVAINSNTSVVVFGWDKTVKAWDLNTGNERFTLPVTASLGYSSREAISADGSVVLAKSEDKSWKVWDLNTGNERFTLPDFRESFVVEAISADGSVGVSRSSSTLTVWNLETLEAIACLTTEHRLMGCAISADGKTIFAGNQRGVVHFLRLETPQPTKSPPIGTIGQ